MFGSGDQAGNVCYEAGFAHAAFHVQDSKGLRYHDNPPMSLPGGTPVRSASKSASGNTHAAFSRSTRRVTASACLVSSGVHAAFPSPSRRLRGACTPRSLSLYTSDAADEEDSVDLGGRRVIKKK